MLAAMVIAFLGLGSNLGKRQMALRAAISRIAQIPQTQVTAVANFRQTDAVDAPPGSPPFINSAVAIHTTLAPQDLLHHLLRIECELGRSRATPAEKNAPRTIDLDILLFGDQIVSLPDLHIPHPRMASRRFVLEPLAEIAPDALYPPTGKRIYELLAELAPDSSPSLKAHNPSENTP